MEEFHKQDFFTTLDKKRINACWLYLQVTYVSDICTDRKRIDFDANYCTGLVSSSTLTWPKQMMPNPTAWRLWRQAIRRMCTTDGQTLRHPLTNKWVPYRSCQRSWRYFYNPITCVLQDTLKPVTYALIGDTRHQQRFCQTSYSTIDWKCIPVKPNRKENKCTLITLPNPTNEKALERRKEVNPKHTTLVSEGLVVNGQGTYGWVKATKKEVIETGMGRVPGNNATTSYRVEAQGVIDGLFSGLIPMGLNVYLDNESVVNQLNNTWPLHPLNPEWELLEQTRKLVQEKKLLIQHVKGHQDLNHPKTSREAHYNHQADRLANTAHGEGDRIGIQPPGFHIVLYIQCQPITTNYTAEIQRAATTPDICNYYIRKHNWTDQTMSLIDWDTLGGGATGDYGGTT